MKSLSSHARFLPYVIFAIYAKRGSQPESFIYREAVSATGGRESILGRNVAMMVSLCSGRVHGLLRHNANSYIFRTLSPIQIYVAHQILSCA